MISVGSLAAHCGSSLSRRLRSVGVSVEHLTCRQPATLARLEYNTHLVGRDPRYMFAKPKVLLSFTQMIGAYIPSRVAKADQIIALHRSTMSSDKHSAMTSTALTELLSRSITLDTSLFLFMATPSNIRECDSQLRDIRDLMKEMNNSFQSLLNLLLADAYAYRAITDAEAKQVSVASREQHMKGTVDFGAEVDSLDASTITKTSSVTWSTASATTRSVQGSMAKSLFTVSRSKLNTRGIASSNASTTSSNPEVKASPAKSRSSSGKNLSSPTFLATPQKKTAVTLFQTPSRLDAAANIINKAYSEVPSYTM